jgi:hypothetical protein
MPTSPYKLQLTKGFFADFRQIARLLAYAIQRQGDRRIPPDAFAETMGISAVRVANLSSLAVALGLLRPAVLIATELGGIVRCHDPFLDDVGTLWLLHYLVGSNERYVVWNRLVNRVIPENDRFSTAIARPYFDDLRRFYSERSVEEHLSKEISIVWNAYLEQGFRHLDYVRAQSDQVYVRGDREPVSPLIFCTAVLSYRQRFAPRAVTLDISVLAGTANSPGRVFGLTERQVRDLLEDVQGLGYLYVESRADLDHVRFRDDLRILDVMPRYYGER